MVETVDSPLWVLRIRYIDASKQGSKSTRSYSFAIVAIASHTLIHMKSCRNLRKRASLDAFEGINSDLESWYAQSRDTPDRCNRVRCWT